MFTTIFHSVAVRIVVFSIPLLFVVGCGSSASTYNVDEKQKEEKKNQAYDNYYKGATPEQKAQMDKNKAEGFDMKKPN